MFLFLAPTATTIAGEQATYMSYGNVLVQMWLNNYVISGWQEARGSRSMASEAREGALGWPTIARLSAKVCQEFQMRKGGSGAVWPGENELR